MNCKDHIGSLPLRLLGMICATLVITISMDYKDLTIEIQHGELPLCHMSILALPFRCTYVRPRQPTIIWAGSTCLFVCMPIEVQVPGSAYTYMYWHVYTSSVCICTWECGMTFDQTQMLVCLCLCEWCKKWDRSLAVYWKDRDKEWLIHWTVVVHHDHSHQVFLPTNFYTRNMCTTKPLQYHVFTPIQFFTPYFKPPHIDGQEIGIAKSRIQ